MLYQHICDFFLKLSSLYTNWFINKEKKKGVSLAILSYMTTACKLLWQAFAMAMGGGKKQKYYTSLLNITHSYKVNDVPSLQLNEASQKLSSDSLPCKTLLFSFKSYRVINML